MNAQSRNQFSSIVLSNNSICRDHYRLILGVDSFPPTAPGQFVQVSCRSLEMNYSPEHEVEWEAGRPMGLTGRELLGPLAFLRRPFSLAGRREVAGGVELEIIYRTVGVGTSWLSHVKKGEAVQILGPLGNQFQLPGEKEVAILIGGGVGIPPMMYLAEKLVGRKGIVFCGALTRELLPLTVTADALAPTGEGVEPLYNIEEFARHGVPAVICTDDGSYGYRGLVTVALEKYLDKYFPAIPTGGLKPVLYTCGPEGMMKRVAEIGAKRGIECQISVERAMACGMGTCQSCVIKLKKPEGGERPWVYKLTCTDGPVFRGGDLLW